MLKILKIALFFVQLIPVFALLNLSYQNLNDSLIQTHSEIDGTERILELFKNTTDFNLDLKHKVDELYHKSELILDPEIKTYYLAAIYVDCFVDLYQNMSIDERFKLKTKCDNKFESLMNSMKMKKMNDKKIESLIKDFRIKILNTDKGIVEELEILKSHQLNALNYLNSLLIKRIQERKEQFRNDVIQFLFILILTYLLFGIAFKIYETKLKRSEEARLKNSQLALVGELTSSIGHEMATPLSVLSLNISKSLRELEMDELDKAKITKNILASQKMLNLILSINKSIRSLSLVQTESKELVNFNVNSIFEDLKLLVENYSHKNQTELIFKIDKNESLMALGFESEVLQILTNLVKNAVDACQNSEIKKIFIDLALSDTHIIFQIADTGSGLSAKQIEKIFEPLYSTKINKGGTGLGLSISLKMAKEMQGELFVKSVKNEYGGATFALKVRRSI